MLQKFGAEEFENSLKPLIYGVLEDFFSLESQNPVSGATTSQPPKTRAFSAKNASKLPNYDTKRNNCATYLYKVNTSYYFRKRYGKRLFRVSLYTKDYIIALQRKKTLLLMGEEVFKYERGDFKLIFEYETQEELKETLEALNFSEISKERAEIVQNHINSVKSHIEQGNVTFEEIETAYLLHKKNDKKMSEDSLYAYTTTFKLLKQFFKDVDVNTLQIQNFMKFKNFLINDYKPKGANISSKSVNKHLIYTKNFIKYASTIKLLKEDITEGLPLLSTTADEEIAQENYTDEEIKTIINYNNYKNNRFGIAFKILCYTGMRAGEVYEINKNDIINENDIYCINIHTAKTKSGIRKVPIPDVILDEVLSADFPLFDDYTKANYQKELRKQLQKILTNNYKTVHRLRGTFIQKALDINTDRENIIYLVQSIVGHSKDDKIALTVDTYAKGFNIKLLKEVINTIQY
jgi:integrase